MVLIGLYVPSGEPSFLPQPEATQVSLTGKSPVVDIKCVWVAVCPHMSALE